MPVLRPWQTESYKETTLKNLRDHPEQETRVAVTRAALIHKYGVSSKQTGVLLTTFGTYSPLYHCYLIPYETAKSDEFLRAVDYVKQRQKRS